MKTVRNVVFLGVASIGLSLALPCFFASVAFAQEDDQQTPDARPNERSTQGADGDLIGRLNLTPDQVRRIREIRQLNAGEMRETRQRMIRAQRELDEAIYADSVDEAAIEGRARELAAAQVAVARLRALTELRIRRLLTPEQLNLLREFRQQARTRDRERPRSRRPNANAFQQRNRPNGLKPGTTVTPPATTTGQKP